MSGRPVVDSILWRNVPIGEFYNVERNPSTGVQGGRGSLYFEIPRGVVPGALEFLGFPGLDVGTMDPIIIEAKAIGNPAVSATLEFRRKSGGRIRIANQNRQQPDSKRHPAWVEALGFPKAPDSVASSTDAQPYFPVGGLRIYIVKTVSGEYFAGFTKGLRPAGMIRDDPMWGLYNSQDNGGLIKASTRRQMIADNVKDILTSWRNGRNALLYGPPGTGKTKLISELFDALQSSMDDPSAIELEPANTEAPLSRPSLEINIPRPAKVIWATFHQSYGYEDFVLGMRVENVAGATELKPRAGIFLDAALELADSESAYKSVVLFIDEINRGNAARIFGEFMTFLDFDYRQGGQVPLPLPLRQLRYLRGESEEILRPGGETTRIPEGFTFPRDIYIVATMNSVDRAAVPIDSALARRFDRVEMRPNLAVLEDHWQLDVTGIPSPESSDWVEIGPLATAYRILDRLNVVIASELGPEFELGHGLLTPIQVDTTDEDGTRIRKSPDMLWMEFARIWDQVLFPQLEDRYSGRPEKLMELLHVDSPPEGDYAWRIRRTLSTVIEAQTLDAIRVSDLDLETIKKSFRWLAK